MKALQLLILALAFFSVSVATATERGASSAKPWAKYCHTGGIKTRTVVDQRYVANLANICEALDACLLACMRSGCAERVGGGCSHACSSPNGELKLMQAASEYETGTAYLCRRPPNNSFKPKPLRGSA